VGVFKIVLRPVVFVALLAALTTGPVSTAGAAEDTTPPEFTYRLLGLSSSDWIEHATWGSKDDLSGVDHSVARWRTKELGGTWSRWHRPLKWRDLPASASIDKHFKAGHRYQIQARVVDIVGNRSAWEAMGGGVRPRS
jgi:hypothetical protein